MENLHNFTFLKDLDIKNILKINHESGNYYKWMNLAENENFVKSQLKMVLNKDEVEFNLIKIEENLKALMQILKLDGFLHTEMISTQNVSDIRRGAIKVYTQDSKNPATSAANWNYPSFLLFHLYFLITLYLGCQKNQYKPLPTDNVEDILPILENEIWIVANAYHIYTTYNNIYAFTKANPSEQNQHISLLVEKLFEAISSTDRNEIVLPCGNKDHAICLVIVKYKNNHSNNTNLLIRLDDPGQEKPILKTSLSLTSSEHKTTFINFIQDVCLANFLKKEEADALLNKTELPSIELMNNFIPLESQKTHSCVVHSYLMGMYYRLFIVGGEIGKAFNWMYAEEKALVARNVNQPSQFKGALEWSVIKSTSFELDRAIKNRVEHNNNKPEAKTPSFFGSTKKYITISMPESLALHPEYAPTLKKNLQERLNSNQNVIALMKFLVDPDFKDEKEFVKELIRKTTKSDPDPNQQAYLAWLEKNFEKVGNLATTTKFEEESIDLFIRETTQNTIKIQLVEEKEPKSNSNNNNQPNGY